MFFLLALIGVPSVVSLYLSLVLLSGGARRLWRDTAVIVGVLLLVALWRPMIVLFDGGVHGSTRLTTWVLALSVLAGAAVLQLLARSRIPLVGRVIASAITAVVVTASAIMET